jgi:hypothetical protein
MYHWSSGERERKSALGSISRFNVNVSRERLSVSAEFDGVDICLNHAQTLENNI